MNESEMRWRRTEFGYFRNSGLNGQLLGYETEGPIRYDNGPRVLLGLIPFWPFTRRPFRQDYPVWRFKLRMENPLTFVCGKRPAALLDVPTRTEIQPSKDYETDWGTIRGILQAIYDKCRFIWFLFHDSDYAFGSCWMRLPNTKSWFQYRLTQWQADKLLEYGVGAQDGNALDRGIIFQAVHVGGKFVWRH